MFQDSEAEGVCACWVEGAFGELYTEVGPPVLVAQTRDAQAIRTRFWCVPVQKAAKSPPCSLLFLFFFHFFHFFHFLSFFSCFLLPNTHSKHLSCWQTCRPKKLRRRTEKSVPPSLSVEAKREKHHWVSYVFRWNMLWNYVQFLTFRSSRAPAVPDLVHFFGGLIWCLFSFMIQAPVPMARRSSSGS